MFTAALFKTARTWKQPKCPATDEWIKMWCIYPMEYCVRAKSLQSCPTPCDPMDWEFMGFPRQEYWSGLPFPSPNAILLIHKKEANNAI